MRKRRALLSVTVSLVVLLPACCAAAAATAAAAAAWCEGASRFSSGPRSAPLLRCGGVHCSGERQAHLALRGGGNSLGSNGEAITEEQAGEELIKAATANNIAVSPDAHTHRPRASPRATRLCCGALHDARSVVSHMAPHIWHGSHCIGLCKSCRGWIQQGSTF